MGIDYGQLIDRAFRIAWKYKSLWVFGLFVGSSSGSWNFDSDDFVAVTPDAWSGSPSFGGFDDLPFSLNEGVLAAIVVWALFLGLLFFICNIIATPALIDAINKITRGGSYTFGSSFSRGLDFFLRFLGVKMLAVVLAVIAIGFVVVLTILSPISLILTIPTAIVVGFVCYHIFSLGEIAMVARDVSIFDGLSEGFELLKRNVGKCIIISLIIVGLAIGFAIVIGILALVTFLPLNFILADLTGDIVALALLGLFIGLPVSLVVGGFTGTFFNSLYVQFYFGLVEPPQPLDGATDSPTPPIQPGLG